jgi:hypothetical protein
MAAVVGISRQTLARHVRERHVSADAFEGNRAYSGLNPRRV